jgi:multidrug efflux pump subunit AcrA (membrane-fusion protein)
MFARVRIVLAEVEAAGIVPLDALARREGRDVVFVLEDAGVVRMVEVRRGITEGDRVQIVEPPIRGQVVTLGQQLLQDGSVVRVVESTVGEAARTQAPASPGGGSP